MMFMEPNLSLVRRRHEELRREVDTNRLAKRLRAGREHRPDRRWTSFEFARCSQAVGEVRPKSV